MWLFTQNLLPHLVINSDFRVGFFSKFFQREVGSGREACEDGAEHVCGSDDGQVRSARSHRGLIFTYEIVSYM